MDREYLLTYFYTNEYSNSVKGFRWFETKEEMKGYIKRYKNLKNFEIIEAIKIIDAEDIILD